MRTIFTLLLGLSIIFTAFGQRQERLSPYKLNKKIDVPLAVAGAAVTAYGFYRLTQKSDSDSLEIVNLNYQNDVSRINRNGGPRYSESASKTSDILFYGSMPLPFLVLLDKNIWRDKGRISVMYIQALGLTGTMYTTTATNVDKYRPLAYDESAPFDERAEGNAKNSFFGGHPSVTATSMFFAAKVVSDYYPDRKGLHWAMYGGAAVATFANAYLRVQAGKHFPTDVAVGSLIGALNGILVPQLHKVRDVDMDKKLSWNFITGNAHGIALTYKLD
ncbi:MAG: phosphatase PAP2 family protein [Bacteroidota bacterium]